MKYLVLCFKNKPILNPLGQKFSAAEAEEYVRDCDYISIINGS